MLWAAAGLNVGGSVVKPLLHIAGSLVPLLKSLFEIAALVGLGLVLRFWYMLRRGPHGR
jgi:hypothetical protein